MLGTWENRHPGKPFLALLRPNTPHPGNQTMHQFITKTLTEQYPLKLEFELISFYI